MNPDNLTDEELFYLVSAIDKECFESGVEIERRLWEVLTRAMKKFGYVGYHPLGGRKPPVATRIESIFQSIYKAQHIAADDQIGIFMYRDIFARIRVPHLFGEVAIRPFEYVDLTPFQFQIIQTEKVEAEKYIDQFSDIFDVHYGSINLKKRYTEMEMVSRFLGLAQLHLHSAAAILTGCFSFRGAIQSSLLATELALKAGVAAQGLTELEIKNKFGHEVNKLADSIALEWPSFDIARVKRVLEKQPKFVLNRYTGDQPLRRDVGSIAMNSQYLVSEVVRQLSDQNFRNALPELPPRSYPA